MLPFLDQLIVGFALVSLRPAGGEAVGQSFGDLACGVEQHDA